MFLQTCELIPQFHDLALLFLNFLQEIRRQLPFVLTDLAPVAFSFSSLGNNHPCFRVHTAEILTLRLRLVSNRITE